MDSQSQMENRMRLATKNEMDQPNKLFPILPTQKVCLILIKNEITAAGTCKLDNFLFRNSFPNAQIPKNVPLQCMR